MRYGRTKVGAMDTKQMAENYPGIFIVVVFPPNRPTFTSKHPPTSYRGTRMREEFARGENFEIQEQNAKKPLLWGTVSFLYAFHLHTAVFQWGTIMKKWSELLNRSKQEIGRDLVFLDQYFLYRHLPFRPFYPTFLLCLPSSPHPEQKKGVTHPRISDVGGGRFDPR